MPSWMQYIMFAMVAILFAGAARRTVLAAVNRIAVRMAQKALDDYMHQVNKIREEIEVDMLRDAALNAKISEFCEGIAGDPERAFALKANMNDSFAFLMALEVVRPHREQLVRLLNQLRCRDAAAGIEQGTSQLMETMTHNLRQAGLDAESYQRLYRPS